ncbi:hypothetical protein ACT18_00545 [Mycolicibacter kumamotonensis]|uniref:Glycosyltransferase n=1 Tax=Mycolicibacter kumamotonensis TaxID=354243 RepID=A0A1B8SL43_9MYCO|nr:hypothetical protein ACT18_00545 [Mycolicibacter kumamotonensis]
MDVAVIAHPRRKDRANRLAEALRADAVCWDNNLKGAEFNHAQAWNYLKDSSADYALIVEDDMVPTEDFIDQARHALAHLPKTASIASFYLGRMRPPHWQPSIARALTTLPTADTCWLIGKPLLSATAYAMRPEHLGLLAQVRTFRGDTRPVDERISAWMHRFKLKAAYSVPSIIEHADIEPVIAKRTDDDPRLPGRTAWRVGTRTDWNRRSHPLKSPEQLGIKVIKPNLTEKFKKQPKPRKKTHA